MKQPIIFAAGFCFALLATLVLGQLYHKPRLVGLGCFDAGGPIYAEEESDFPLCEEIREND